MFKRLASIGVGLAVLGFAASAAPARDHKGERPEPGRHGRGNDDRVKHAAEPADNHGKSAGKDGARDKNDHRGNDGRRHK